MEKLKLFVYFYLNSTNVFTVKLEDMRLLYFDIIVEIRDSENCDQCHP